jgi:UDP-N-acetylglucosamine acyltransferase
MSKYIHPTALVAEGAQLGQDVSVGAYAIIGPDVILENSAKIHSHVVIEGHTTVGAHTQVFPFSVLGLAPQSTHYKGEPTRLTIGENCIIREHVTIHRGTVKGGMETTVGANCYIMIGAHIGHDCHVGNFVTMANNATLGGHVTVGDYTTIGGLAAIHQFVRIGPYAMISGTAGVNEDVIPFGTIMAIRAKLGGLNLIGMKRHGFGREEIHALRNAYKLLAKDQQGTLEERLNKIKAFYGSSKSVKSLLGFIEQDPKKPLCLPAEDWEFDTDDTEEPPLARSA